MMSWWQERSGREQMLLKGLAAISTVLIVFQFIFVPVKSFRDDSLEAYGNATTLLAEIEAGAARSRVASAIGALKEDDRSVRVLATELAREMGLTITRLSPAENEGLTVWLDNTEGPLMFRWLLRLQDEYGVIVRRAAVHKGESVNLIAEFTFGRA